MAWCRVGVQVKNIQDLKTLEPGASLTVACWFHHMPDHCGAAVLFL
jgi:hypothetical protein